jgi:predicted CXXCH cytochrome family protein
LSACSQTLHLQKVQHRTHGNFQNNTNSCANCHSTHNGDNAQLLRFETSEYDLCTSCHDGTLGFYNVEAASGAGVFSTLTGTHDSVSMHDVKGNAKVGSAPGTTVPAGSANAEATLACSSCHNPHGKTNDSDRLLKSEVNGVTLAAPVKLELTVVQEIGTLKIYASKGTQFDGSGSTNTPQQAYSAFCAACHDDYLSSRTSQRADGHYTHTTNSSKAGRNCGSCHYAHGTDITLLKDTAGKTIADYVNAGTMTADQAKEYMQDVSEGGSDLKKYTNMAVCWACHQSTHKLDTPAVPGGNYQGKPAR